MNLDHFKVFIFDLDNTIYDERDYLFPAYRSIGDFVSLKDSVNSDEASYYLIETFQQSGRHELFDKFIEHFKIQNSSVKDFLQILRTNKIMDKIKMFPVIEKLLKEFIANKKKIFVLTNGTVEQQKNKVSLIDWQGLEEHINFVYANEIEKKPSPKAILQIINDNHFKEGEMIFIGDNLEDELCAKNAGIKFLNVKNLF